MVLEGESQMGGRAIAGTTLKFTMLTNDYHILIIIE